MLPAESSRALYQQYLHDKDEKLRAAAAEGYARLRNPADLPMLEEAWQDENEDVAAAVAGVRAGDVGEDGGQRVQPAAVPDQQSEFGELQGRGVAVPGGVGARRDSAQGALRARCRAGTKDEKIGICGVLARSGDQASVPELQKLNSDPDTEVAKEALKAVRTLQAR